MLKLFSMITALEHTCLEKDLKSKAALINQFGSSVVSTGIVFSPTDMTVEECY